MSRHHEQSVGATDEWFTPPYVFDAMGARFDLDVSHPGWALAPWTPADAIITADSLESSWSGFVWMNPPFGGRNGIVPWLDKFFAHGDGVALTPDRTSAPWWIRFAAKADAVLFVGQPNPKRGDPNKIKFIKPDGTEGTSPTLGTTLLAIGRRGVEALERAERAGLGILLRRRSDGALGRQDEVVQQPWDRSISPLQPEAKADE